MTEGVRQWLLSLVAVSLLWSVAEAVTPAGLCRRVCRMVGGLLMILVMLQPLWSLPGMDLHSWLEEELSVYPVDNANGYGEDLMEGVIIDSTQAYIEKQAQELGVTVEAEVSCRREEELCLPNEVIVTGNLSEEQKQALSGLIERELEIPVDRQKYREAGT